jgi:choline kinase
VHALILAAGQGRRLDDRLGRPKCLREVGGVPLVHHQLAALAAAGITSVALVVGFGQEQIRESVGSAATYVVNERFAETNSMMSFVLGQRAVDDDVVVLNSDVFCHPGLMDMIAGADGDALLYDSGSGNEAEQMKVRVEHGRLVGMSKALHPMLVGGENLGMLRMSRDTAAAVGDAATRIVSAGGERAWLATAVNEVAPERPFRCLDVAGWPWVEIDFPEDLVRARGEVLAAVSGTAPTPESDYAFDWETMRRVS